MMKNIWKLLAVLAVAGGLAACDKDPYGEEDPEETGVLVLEDFYAKTNISTKLEGSVLGIPADGEITEYGFLVSGYNPFENAEAIAYAAEEVRKQYEYYESAYFSCRITGLVPNTTYYFKLYYILDGEMIVEETVHEFTTRNFLMFTCRAGNVGLEFSGPRSRNDLLFSVDGEVFKKYESQLIILTKGQTVQFVNEYTQYKSSLHMHLSDYTETYKFKTIGTGELSVSGDLTSLVSSENFYDTDFKIPLRTFYELFMDCTVLVDAGELIFPEVGELGKECYCEMFKGCTNLVRAPGRIPGKTTGESSCDQMFYNCTSLTAAPELPATELGRASYSEMFRECSSLRTAPALLPATTVPDLAYNSMFDRCSSLEKAPKIAGTSFGNESCRRMFFLCENLTQAPEFNEATLSSYCFCGMFQGCYKLTTAPALPSKYLADYCYSEMFSSCNSLTTAKKIGAQQMAEGSCSKMFYSCDNLTYAPDLPAMKLAKECYSYMFILCSNLTKAPALPATNLAPGCYSHMFSQCSNLTKAPALPATSLTQHCYDSMFYKCTSLTATPDLVAPEMADYCYNSMFMGCSKLNYIKIYATVQPKNADCLYNMAADVAEKGDVYVRSGEIMGWVRDYAGSSLNSFKSWNWHYF